MSVSPNFARILNVRQHFQSVTSAPSGGCDPAEVGAGSSVQLQVDRPGQQKIVERSPQDEQLTERHFRSLQA
jgi:hypothetical protein